MQNGNIGGDKDPLSITLSLTDKEGACLEGACQYSPISYSQQVEVSESYLLMKTYVHVYISEHLLINMSVCAIRCVNGFES